MSAPNGSSQPIYVIAPVGTLARLVRTQKIREILVETGRPIVHLAWEREPGDDAPVEGVTRSVVLQGGGYQSGGLPKWYLIYALACRKALGQAPSHADVYVLGMAGGIGILGVAPWKRLNVLFDNNDNLALYLQLPTPLKKVVQALEKAMVRRSRVHLVPGVSRWATKDRNLRIVPNVPSASVMKAAEEVVTRESTVRPDRFTLYVNGWLAPTRGLAAVAGALRLLPEGTVRVLLAGRVETEDEDLKFVMAHPDVTYLGPKSNAEALALYRAAHVVLTYYDPAVTINRLAEPNKWGDCIATGTPFLCNSEVETAKPFLQAGAAFAVPYADHAALATLLADLAANLPKVTAAGESIKSFGMEPWDVQMRRVFAEWLAR
jgi:glycosyltransferase involved in cell wall biosynthesis